MANDDIREIDEEISSLIIHTKFYSEPSKADTRVALDSQTACPQIAIEGMITSVEDLEGKTIETIDTKTGVKIKKKLQVPISF